MIKEPLFFYVEIGVIIIEVKLECKFQTINAIYCFLILVLGLLYPNHTNTFWSQQRPYLLTKEWLYSGLEILQCLLHHGKTLEFWKKLF